MRPGTWSRTPFRWTVVPSDSGPQPTELVGGVMATGKHTISANGEIQTGARGARSQRSPGWGPRVEGEHRVEEREAVRPPHRRGGLIFWPHRADADSPATSASQKTPPTAANAVGGMQAPSRRAALRAGCR